MCNGRLYTSGAFGVVHKGEFVDPDGSMMPIAIKTIKCKFNTTAILTYIRISNL